MSRRRPRRPFRAGVTALDRLMARIRPEPGRSIAALQSALEVVTRGQRPEEAEWRDLADVVNHVETLMLEGYLLREEVAPMVAAGTAGMTAAAERWRAGHGVRLDAAGLKAMRDLLAAYEACAAELEPSVMEGIRRLTADRIRAYHAGRPPAGVEFIAV